MISSRDFIFDEPEEFMLDLEPPLMTDVQTVLQAGVVHQIKRVKKQ